MRTAWSVTMAIHSQTTSQCSAHSRPHTIGTRTHQLPKNAESRGQRVAPAPRSAPAKVKWIPRNGCANAEDDKVRHDGDVEQDPLDHCRPRNSHKLGE